MLAFSRQVLRFERAAIMVTEMKKGYDKSFAAGLIAYGGMLGPIIPPSVMFVVYSALAPVSGGVWRAMRMADPKDAAAGVTEFDKIWLPKAPVLADLRAAGKAL